MLCLTINLEENIIFDLSDGRKIKIMLLDKHGYNPSGKRVFKYIGIDAPKDVQIYREKRTEAKNGKIQTADIKRNA